MLMRVETITICILVYNRAQQIDVSCELSEYNLILYYIIVYSNMIDYHGYQSGFQ